MIVLDENNVLRGSWIAEVGKASLGIYDKSGRLRASLGNTVIEVTKTGLGGSSQLWDRTSKLLLEIHVRRQAVTGKCAGPG